MMQQGISFGGERSWKHRIASLIAKLGVTLEVNLAMLVPKIKVPWERRGSALTRRDLYDVLSSTRYKDVAEKVYASSDSSDPEVSIPTGALLRALEFGKILDKRVKVSIIGPDRVGKTSLGKSLRGEPFNPEEPSTDGVQMSLPVKNAGTEPWKNLDSHQHTTAFDHKWAEMIIKEKQATEQQPPSEAKKDDQEIDDEEEAPQVDTPVPVILGEDLIKSRSKEIAALMEDGGNGSEEVWPVMWDFAGQAVYHAIHPLFMSPEAIYLLVVDLTKELSDLAQSFVKVGGHEEERASSTESGNTNLDILTQWLTLVHYLKQSGGNSTVRSVILVGTKADMVEGDPCDKMKSFVENISETVPEVLLKHIAVPDENFVVDNSKADTLSDQKSQPIVKLRDFILKTAKEMPHTKEPIPLQWLSAELKVQEKVRQNEPYVPKSKFRRDIAEKCCTRSEDDDVEGLLCFLSARGAVIYHALPDDPDGLVVLDPKWLIETINKIITARPSWTYPLEYKRRYDRLKNTGILCNELIDFACKKLNIVEIKNNLILIMKEFHLIFEWKSKNEDLIYFVPCMLSQNTEANLNTGPTPLCLSFSETGYLPCGFFSRLVVRFGEWASEKCSARQPNLRSDVALFFVGEKFSVRLVRHSSLIKVSFSSEDASDQVDEDKFRVKILRRLKKCVKKLRIECLWLRAIPFKLYARCELCPTTGDETCKRHRKQECSHDDCADYIDLETKPLVCKRKGCRLPPHLKEKYIPWIEAIDALYPKEKTGSTNESQESSAKRKGTFPSCSTIKRSKRSKDASGTMETAEGSTNESQESSAKRKETFPSCSTIKRSKRSKDASGTMETAEGSTNESQESSAKRKGTFPSCSTIKRSKRSKDASGTMETAEVAVKDGVPDKKVLDDLAGEIRVEWKNLGRRLLNYDEATLEAIDVEKKQCHEKAYKMLLAWKMAEGSNATYCVLCDALCDAKLKDLAEKFCLSCHDSCAN